jgi:hypothetical protein
MLKSEKQDVAADYWELRMFHSINIMLRRVVMQQ